MDAQNQTTTALPDAEQNKLMAILAYILFFIPLLVAKDSAFAKYHANQGTWLFIIGFALTLILGVVSFGCLTPVTSVIWLVYAILGIVNATQGEMKPLPGFASLPVLVK